MMSTAAVARVLFGKRCAPLFRVSVFAMLVVVLNGCVKRGYNQATEQTIHAPSKDRLAFSYVGLGWCYYIEDKSYTPTVVKTGLEDAEVSINLETGVERRDKYEVVFSRRKFLKAHQWPLEFDTVGEWLRRLHSNSIPDELSYQVFYKLSQEIDELRGSIEMRKLEKGFCEAINSGNALKLKTMPSLEQKARITEYTLRCDKETGEIMRRSDYEILDVTHYQRLRGALQELTNSPDWKKYQRSGSPCHEHIFQFEVSRGKYLGSEVKKVW